MGIETIIAVGSLAVSAGSGYASYKNQRKSIKQANAASEYTKQQNNLAEARQKRDAVRQARIARALATNSSATQGVMDSSSSIGGLGSIQSQLRGELSFLDQFNRFGDQATTAMGRAQKYENRANTFGSVSKIALSAFNNSDTLAKQVQKVFG